jgi:hypothetical protein
LKSQAKGDGCNRPFFFVVMYHAATAFPAMGNAASQVSRSSRDMRLDLPILRIGNRPFSTSRYRALRDRPYSAQAFLIDNNFVIHLSFHAIGDSAELQCAFEHEGEWQRMVRGYWGIMPKLKSPRNAAFSFT